MEQPVRSEEHPRRREKLPRREILRRRSVLQRIRAHGKRRSNRWVVLLVEPCPQEAQSQAAFITPKRIGDAHVRNRLRRRMREIYRRHIADGSEKRYWVWLARTNAAESTFPELKEAMLQLSQSQKSSRRSA